MWLAKLKKKKKQYFLLGIIMTITIILISVSSIISIISGQFSKEYYKGDNTPDIHLISMNKSVINKTKSWYDENKSTLRNYKEYEIYSISTNVSFDKKSNTAMMSYVIPMKSIESLSNKIEIREGNKNKSPNKGEIWIPSTIADSKNLSIGENVEIVDSKGEKLKFKISAIVNDSNQASSVIGNVYLYINNEDEKVLKNLPKAKMVTMNCDGNPTERVDELDKYINEPLAGMLIDKNLYIMSVNMTTAMMTGLGLIVSIIVLIALVLILKSNIKNNILKEYKAIGIYKSIGLSSKKIKSIYLKGYLLISVISSIIGIILSIPIINYICNITFKYMGKYHFDMISLAILLIVFLIFNLIIYIVLNLSLNFVVKIKPVDAINIGIKSTKSKISKSLIKNSSRSFFMAINDMFKYKKNNFLICTILAFVFYIAILFLNIYSSLNTLDDNFYKIFGTAKADITISAATDIENSIKDIKDYLDTDKRVDNYYTWDCLAQNNIGIDKLKYNIKSSIIIPTVYNKFNEEDFSITKGINPRNENEVAISNVILKETDLKIGDYINLQINNKPKKFLIVGSFNAMMSNGYTLRLTSEALNNNNGNVAFVKLRNKNDYINFKKDINRKFDGIVAGKIYAPLEDATAQVEDILVPISLITLIGMLIFGFINIINIILINNLDNKINYGILKSLGFTSKYIKRRNNFRIFILTTIATVLGVICNCLISKKLLELCLGFDVLSFNISITARFILIVFILISVIMKICNRGIDKISIIDLIKE